MTNLPKQVRPPYQTAYYFSPSLVAQAVKKKSACNAENLGLIPRLGRSLGEGNGTHSSILAWRRKWQPTPVFLPGEFHGQRSLVGYSPWGHKESDRTDRLTLSFIHRKGQMTCLQIFPPDSRAAIRERQRMHGSSGFFIHP